LSELLGFASLSTNLHRLRYILLGNEDF